MRSHVSQKQLVVRVGLFVFLIVVVCFGILMLFHKLSSS
jgi:hypothetical protein